MQPATAKTDFRLLPIGRNGRVWIFNRNFPDAITDACRSTADMYKRGGFAPPWIGYVAMASGKPVGGGAFVEPPRYRQVEIAYFTLPEHQNLGHARRIAEQLIAIARARDPAIEFRAKTAPAENASTAILRDLGFRRTADVIDDEIGEAWCWLLAHTPH